MQKETNIPPTEFESSPENKNVTFLFVDHSAENTAEITRRVADSDADVVLQELVGSSTDVRKNVENKINAGIMSSNLADRSKSVQNLKQEFKDLVWALAGSKKEFHFVDVANDIPEYKLILQARNAYISDPDNYNHYFRKSIDARNKVLESQIATAQDVYSDKKILVVLGAIHSDVSDGFTDSDVLYSGLDVQKRARDRMAELALSSARTT